MTLPGPVVGQFRQELGRAVDMVLALQYLCGQQPQDEVMAASLYAIGACVEKLDDALASLDGAFSEALQSTATGTGEAS